MTVFGGIMLKSKGLSLVAAFALGGGAFIMACGEEKSAAAPKASVASPVVEVKAEPAPAAAPAPAPVFKPGDGVAGVVKIKGEAPKRRKIKMDADPKCAAMHAEAPMQDDIVVDASGNVQYAFVHISKGLEGKTFPKPAAPAKIDQKGCRYEPHVVGVMVGQDLEISNSDDLLHNVHGLPFVNKEFNFGQPTKGLVEKKQFTAKEVMMKVKCDVHPWMSAWVGVTEHPFFAVTDAAGKFAIKGVPDGKYTLEVWHERYKSVTAEIEVKGGDAAANFELADKKE
jgi:hypothetical protein